MPICKKCNNQFLNKIKINGKVHNLQRRKYCLECSPFKKHNTKRLEIIKDRILENGEEIRICIQCNREFKIGINKKHGKKCNSCYTNSRRKRIKQKCIDYFNGECQICGYNKCISALEFHHIDPYNKKFAISGSHCRSWKQIEEELKKCILVCANCHAEIHSSNNNSQV